MPPGPAGKIPGLPKPVPTLPRPTYGSPPPPGIAPGPPQDSDGDALPFTDASGIGSDDDLISSKASESPLDRTVSDVSVNELATDSSQCSADSGQQTRDSDKEKTDATPSAGSTSEGSASEGGEVAPQPGLRPATPQRPSRPPPPPMGRTPLRRPLGPPPGPSGLGHARRRAMPPAALDEPDLASLQLGPRAPPAHVLLDAFRSGYAFFTGGRFHFAVVARRAVADPVRHRWLESSDVVALPQEAFTRPLPLRAPLPPVGTLEEGRVYISISWVRYEAGAAPTPPFAADAAVQTEADITGCTCSCKSAKPDPEELFRASTSATSTGGFFVSVSASEVRVLTPPARLR